MAYVLIRLTHLPLYSIPFSMIAYDTEESDEIYLDSKVASVSH